MGARLLGDLGVAEVDAERRRARRREGSLRDDGDGMV